MTLEDFTRLLDTYGSDLRRWPAQERPGAQALIAAAGQARLRWEAARRLDELLARDRASLGIAARGPAVVNAAMARIRARPTGSPELRWLFTRPAGLVFASVALVGWVAGWMIGPALDGPRPRGVPAVTVILGEAGPMAGELLS